VKVLRNGHLETDDSINSVNNITIAPGNFSAVQSSYSGVPTADQKAGEWGAERTERVREQREERRERKRERGEQCAVYVHILCVCLSVSQFVCIYECTHLF